MIRRFVLTGLAVIALGCEKGHTMPSQPQPWTDFAVPGIDIFVEYSSAGGTAHDSVPVSGMARMNGRTLRGKEAFDAVRAKTGDDPKKLAALAILFLDSAADTHLWTHAITADQQAVATPPQLSGDTLEYWRTSKQTADLMRCRASLKLGKVTCESGYDVAHAMRLAKDPSATVKDELASDNIEVRIQGIADLGTLGGDAARTQLISIELNANQGRERIAAINAVAKLGGPGVVDALTRSLLHDGYAEARQAAAEALGNLHDKSARPALEQARDHDADAGVYRIATEALKKL